MDSDSYQIRVLHFLNPHLMWVEVVQPSSVKSHEDFEQVGVYGIMPLDCTLNILEERLETQKSLNWTPGVNGILTQALAGAAEVWFSPQHIDRRTSIFDSNIHKYGEVIIKTIDGQLKKLSTILTKTNLAYYDECTFFTELSKFNLKTKLDSRTTREVVKILENTVLKTNNKENKDHSDKTVRHQTKVIQVAQNLETTLTMSNLKRHDRSFKEHKTIDKILQQKEKDFQLCKDVNEESVGRGQYRQKIGEDHYSPPQTQPILSEPDDKAIEETGTLQSLMAMKKMLFSKAKGPQQDKAKDEKVQESPKAVTNAPKEYGYYLELNAKKNAELVRAHKERVAKLKAEMKKEAAKMWAKVPKRNVETPKFAEEKMIDIKQVPCEIANENRVTNGNNVKDPLLTPREKIEDKIQNTERRRKSKKSPKFVMPDYDVKTQKRVAYGPPGFDPVKLAYQVIDKENEEPQKQEDICDGESQGNPVVSVDSEVNAPVTYKECIKQCNEKGSDDTSGTSQTGCVDSNVKDISNDLKKESAQNCVQEVQKPGQGTYMSSMLMKKFRFFKQTLQSESSTSDKDNSASGPDEMKPVAKKTNDDSDDESIASIIQRLKIHTKNHSVPDEIQDKPLKTQTDRSPVNPFKNIDPTVSQFVEKLVSPVLLVHTKQNNRIQPLYEMRDISFNKQVHVALKEMQVSHPMTLQTVSWFSILRGYSLFMVSPVDSGKTLGYTPAVCQLVTDYDPTDIPNSAGPICVIVCATSASVADATRQCKRILGRTKTVLSCNSGTSERDITISLLNGCDIFVSTPTALVRLLSIGDFGVDLKRLATFVLDDCERLDEVYNDEIKFFVHKIKDMLKTRANKELKVQFIVASRTWCDFMESLAKKAPKSVVCIGSFQECVLYSKSNMQVSFVKRENKLESVLAFLKTIDLTKRTVIVCRLDQEVNAIATLLKRQNHVVFAVNDTMTVEDLFTLSSRWAEYEDPLTGPILVCCDGNLMHLNITDAHHLMHYSLPSLFSMFSGRFSVLVDNYPSLYREENEEVKIKVLIEEENVEQLPKILNFIKRCSDGIPESLDLVCKNILAEKDRMKAKVCVPFCENTLCFGLCPDFWNCKERHTLFKNLDEPQDWVPKKGVVTFRIIHWQSAVSYSARLITHYESGRTHKYPQTYSSLSLKMNMFYSKESNRQLHGIPKPGDNCAVSVKENFYERCQVVKILNTYEKNGNPNYVLVKMIDDERWERTRDINLYYLPEDIKTVNTFVVQVKLANIKPKDRDVTFPEEAREMLMRLTDSDETMYMRSNVLMTIGNALIVDNLEACQSLASLRETVVRLNIKDELCKRLAIANPDHVTELEKLCARDGLDIKAENIEVAETKIVAKELSKPRWAHLEADFQLCYFASADHPGRFYVRLEKFEDCLDLLTKDVQKYIAEKNPEAVATVEKDDIVLAKFPDDSMYYRARVDKVIDEIKVRCFFVDHGDWRDVQRKDLIPITEAFITKMPFQAIECRLIGITPVNQHWNEFSTNWFCDQCFLESGDDLKPLYVKYFLKEIADCTGGYKYGVAIIDTTTYEDVLINKAMIDNNLAREEEDEIEYLDQVEFKRKVIEPDSDDENDWEKGAEAYEKMKQEMRESGVLARTDTNRGNLDILKKPIRSVPLVENSDESDGEWDVEMSPEVLRSCFKISNAPAKFVEPNEPKKKTVPEILPKSDSAASQSDCSSKVSDFEVIPSPKCMIKELDSDDFSSPEQTVIIEKPLIQEVSLNTDNEQRETTPEISKLVEPQKILVEPILEEVPITKDDRRKPKICWRQNKTSISLRIELIGVEKYDLEIGARHLNFSTTVHDTDYGFELELYSVVNTEKSLHEPKGLYILLKLIKLLPKTWISLSRDGRLKKWIVFDADSIDTSSDEDDTLELKSAAKKVIEQIHNNQSEDDDDDDDDFIDDTAYKHKYRRDSD